MYPTIHRRWKYFQFIVQTAENRRQNLPFPVWRNVLLNLSNNNNIQATISVFRLFKNMSINAKSVEFHQCHAKPDSICFFFTIISKITKEIFVKICWQLKTPTRTWKCIRCIMQMSYLYASDFPFKTFCKLAQHGETIRKKWLRVQTTINHFYILTFLCFLPQYQRQRKCVVFFSERELKKALRDTLTRAAW